MSGLEVIGLLGGMASAVQGINMHSKLLDEYIEDRRRRVKEVTATMRQLEIPMNDIKNRVAITQAKMQQFVVIREHGFGKTVLPISTYHGSGVAMPRLPGNDTHAIIHTWGEDEQSVPRMSKFEARCGRSQQIEIGQEYQRPQSCESMGFKMERLLSQLSMACSVLPQEQFVAAATTTGSDSELKAAISVFLPAIVGKAVAPPAFAGVHVGKATKDGIWARDA